MTSKMLEDLPEDIIIIILKKLDYRSLENLYEASVCMQNIISVYKVAKECNISFSTMATVETIKSQFFLHIAHNLLKLNLSGVLDLSRSTLMPIMKKLKMLETLDVSYTNINLVDFMDIYKVCPTIKNVAINFSLGKKYKRSKLTKITLFECQKVFKQFESVHFVGSNCNLLNSKIAIFILSLANLKILQYTIVEENMPVVFSSKDYDIGLKVNFDHLFVNIPYVPQLDCCINIFAPFNILDYQCYEYLVVSLNKELCVVYATEVFNKFFQERFDLKVNSSTDINVHGSVRIMLWKKNLNVFDDTFYNILYNKIKTYIICYTDDKLNATNLSKYDRFCIKPKIQSEYSCWDHFFKKQRVAPPYYVLNYDKEFKDKQELQLSIIISPYTAITLPSNCEYLQKLTYLNINGSVKYSNNFFNILFRSCVKLVTLNVEVNDFNTNVSPVSRTVPLSHSIKNLRIVGRSIDFNTVFTSLSQCSNLENVHIVDVGHDNLNLFDPTIMFEKCSNLYCMYVYKSSYKSCISDNKLAKQMSLINNAKARCNKKYINFKVFKTGLQPSNPYVQVFRLLQ